jgi:hypothetical protein
MVDISPSLLKPRRRRRVLLLPTRKSWAWDYKAQSIARHLAHQFDISIAYDGDQYNPHNYDHIHYFSWGQINPLLRKCSVSTTVATLNTPSSNEPTRLKMLNVPTAAVSPEVLKYCQQHGLLAVPCYNGVEHDVFVPAAAAAAKVTTSPKLKVFICNKPCGPNNSDSHGMYIAQHLLNIVKNIDTLSTTMHVANHNTKTLCNRQEMIALYQEHHVFVHTGRYHLATPNMAFEAMSCGLPIVSTANGCLPLAFELAGAATPPGFLVDLPLRRTANNNEEEDAADAQVAQRIADRLVELGENRELCRTMGVNARSTIETHWTWEHRAQFYTRLFNM